MLKKVVTLGELLLRLTTESSERFSQAQNFEATFGGSEANIAATIAHLGMWASFISAVPANEIGDAAVEFMRKNGVHRLHSSPRPPFRDLFCGEGALHPAFEDRL